MVKPKWGLGRARGWGKEFEPSDTVAHMTLQDTHFLGGKAGRFSSLLLSSDKAAILGGLFIGLGIPQRPAAASPDTF